MKNCSKCNIQKDLSCFDKDSTKVDFLHTVCKQCKNFNKKAKYKTLNFPRQVSGNKECKICKITKDVSEYHSDCKQQDGLCYNCKECRKGHSKQHYNKNSDEIKKNNNEYAKNNRPKINERVRKTQKHLEATDVFFKLKRRLRNRLYYALKNTVWKKQSKFTSYIGCDRDMLIKHIESQFQLGMTWDNHGEWHLDHKLPLDSATTEQELYTLCHYTNLQPLWAVDNIRKSNKI